MKRSLFSAFAVGLCMTANLIAQVPSYVPTNGLVGWWPFNGNANDESGNGNNGTVNGATLTTDRFGNADKAYSFDGVSNNITLSNVQFTNQIAISYWINIPINGGGMAIVQNIPDPPYYTSFAVPNTQNINQWILYSNNCTSSQTYNLNQQFSILNNWHNIVYTIDNNSDCRLYFDGAFQGIYDGNNFTNCSNSTTNLRFGGKWVTNDPQWFKGLIDDIGIWNRVLSECEIQDLYNAQLGSFSNANVSVNPTSCALGSNATLTVSSPVSSLQWQSNAGNMGWNNVVDNGNYTGATNDTLVVSNLQLSNHNQPFRVLACGDTSNIATIQIADTCITTIYDTLYTTVTDTLIINTTLSLPAPNNENTILIYPNPANDHITIDNGNFAAMPGYSIKIENNAGQQVFQSLINQAQFYVDLSTWTGNGLYFVHLIDPQNNTVTVRKIVLQ